MLLPELDGWTAKRRQAAAAYERLGLGEHAVLPAESPGARHAYHLYVVRARDADQLVARLGDAGVAARGYYRVPVHRQPAIAADADLPATEEAARTNVALPMGPDLSEEQVREVISQCASGST